MDIGFRGMSSPSRGLSRPSKPLVFKVPREMIYIITIIYILRREGLGVDPDWRGDLEAHLKGHHRGLCAHGLLLGLEELQELRGVVRGERGRCSHGRHLPALSGPYKS